MEIIFLLELYCCNFFTVLICFIQLLQKFQIAHENDSVYAASTDPHLSGETALRRRESEK